MQLQWQCAVLNKVVITTTRIIITSFLSEESGVIKTCGLIIFTAWTSKQSHLSHEKYIAIAVICE